MSIPKFSLPNTKLCTVVWYRNNQRHESLIPTPHNTEGLGLAMLAQKVGASEIRAVKAVNAQEIARSMSR